MLTATFRRETMDEMGAGFHCLMMEKYTLAVMMLGLDIARESNKGIFEAELKNCNSSQELRAELEPFTKGLAYDGAMLMLNQQEAIPKNFREFRLLFPGTVCWNSWAKKHLEIPVLYWYKDSWKMDWQNIEELPKNSKMVFERRES